MMRSALRGVMGTVARRGLGIAASASLHAARACSTTASAYTDDLSLEDAFRRYGHFSAQIDPLGVNARVHSSHDGNGYRPELLAAIEKASSDPDAASRVEALKSTYCAAIGAEFEFCEAGVERAWWREQLERRVPTTSQRGVGNPFKLSLGEARNAYSLLARGEALESFLARKFGSFKRYSGEGTEALGPALDSICAAAARSGCDEVVMGMAHRGRLALLASLFAYPVRKLVWKIQGNDDIPAGVQGVDDVSSHIAATVQRSYGGRAITATLLPNPSHLEAVVPVVTGVVRAKQDAGAHALSVLIHGDAAVAAQGVVAETYAMSRQAGYGVGGSVHVVTNNQIGFTSEEANARSSTYASDMAKAVSAPVLHVNGESMRDVILACTLAVEYRARFKKDVVVDLMGYRRHGHNELDAPEFTNSKMYAAIRGRPSFATSYGDSLQAEGILTPTARTALSSKLNAHLEAEFEAARAFTPETGSLGVGTNGAVVGDGSAYSGKWAGIRQAAPNELLRSADTGVDAAALRDIGRASVTLPEGFKVHERLQRSHIAARLACLAGADTAANIDWATAEALAFGSLLREGSPVRLTGQDAQRGTFSHRHAVLTCQASGNKALPLNDALAAPAKMTVVSSLLSEYGVLGFELGYSWESPKPLVLWEAQFGDFANTAQVIIDTFIASSESKWLYPTGLVMLLPHGYDGAGPEHSSARIERYLALTNSQALALPGAITPADKTTHEALNMLIACPTTPANYFHLLRRQIHRPFRKPLIVIAPKTLLRHPQALSALNEMTPGTRFKPVLPDVLADSAAAGRATRVALVAGKLYFELAKRRTEAAAHHVAFIRVEELAPFPTEAIMAHVRATYPRAQEVVWVQEEPANAGAWAHAYAHMVPALAAQGMKPITYIGRGALAAPAVGLAKLNKQQQDAILDAAVRP